METPIGAGHGPGDAAPHEAVSHASGGGSRNTPTRLHQSGGEGGAAGGPSALPGAPRVDERVMKLIHRYATPDQRGWVTPPADMLYKLTNWHRVQITREQLTEVLRAQGYRSGFMR